MTYKGKFCNGTYFGSGNVYAGVRAGTRWLLPTSYGRAIDNGFCIMFHDAEWADVPVGSTHVYHAYPPGTHIETEIKEV